MKIKIKGKIVYDPDRGRLAEEKAKNTIIIEIEDGEDFAAYYRHWFYTTFHVELLKPNYDIHMTISKVYEINDNTWGFLDRKEVDIIVDLELMWNNQFVWLNSYCEEWKQIRKFYGFNEYPNGHITIGKFKNYEQGIINPHVNEDCFW